MLHGIINNITMFDIPFDLYTVDLMIIRNITW